MIPLEEILKEAKPFGVTSIRKYYSNPEKIDIPLFVLTFLGKQLPTQIELAFVKYKIDMYIPSPKRSYKCCRIGHLSSACQSKQNCNKCSQAGHTSDSCHILPADYVCINCKGNHSPYSKECPTLAKERDICRTAIEENISFKEAREKILEARDLVSPINQQYNVQNIQNRGFQINLNEFPAINRSRVYQSQNQQIGYAGKPMNRDNTSAIQSQPTYQNLPSSYAQACSWFTPAQRNQNHTERNSAHTPRRTPQFNQDSQLPELPPLSPLYTMTEIPVEAEMTNERPPMHSYIHKRT